MIFISTNYIAHINDNDDEQSLLQHSRKSARYTAENLRSVKLYFLGYFIGLLHDMGKATRKYIIYLRKSHAGEPVVKGSVIHTFTAVIYIWERYHKTNDPIRLLTAELAAYAAGVHHGLFDCVTFDGKSEFLRRLNKDREEICYDEAVSGFLKTVIDEKELDDLFEKAVKEIQNVSDLLRNPFNCSMTMRLLTSALIDADRQDTEEFMTGKILPGGFDNVEYRKNFWNQNLMYCEQKLESLVGEGAIFKERKRVSDESRHKAEEKSGIYILNAITGSGKTLAALRYALAHAAKYGKPRIISLIPLLTILKQNRDEIKNYLDKNVTITEHHSDIIRTKTDDGSASNEEVDRYDFMLDTWKSDFIISTLVQFMNILFSDKTSAIRRMQALCNSVIIIDEVQWLPWKLTAMFNQALNYLVEFCGVSIVLCSATLPPFEKMVPALKINPDTGMILNKSPYDLDLKRTNIKDRTRTYGYSTYEIADMACEVLKKVSSLLVICNTKKTAQEIYLYSVDRGYLVIHLSKSMIDAHLEKAIKQIKDILDYNMTAEKKIKILCVSTSLMESGMNFSFECGIQILAGMDNTIQCAGRINRAFEYFGLCDVYIVNLKNENIKHLEEIQIRQNAQRKLLNAYNSYPEQYDNDLASEKSIAKYYQCLFKDLESKEVLQYVEHIHGIRKTLYSLLNRGVSVETNFDQMLTQPLKTVGEKFKVFDTNTIEVLVEYDDESEKMIRYLQSFDEKGDVGELKKVLLNAQRYTLQLFSYEIEALGDKIHHYQIQHMDFYVLDKTCYDPNIGFILVDVNELRKRGEHE